MESKAVKHLANIKINDEYGTPISLFLESCGKYNCTPRVDYFASDVNHVCDEYYTKSKSAFETGWWVNGFINAPYSMIGKVMQKAYEEHKKNNIELMILAYAKTDTKWWHLYIENCPTCEVHFIKGRIKFLDAKGKPTKLSAPYPSVWIIYRKQMAWNPQIVPVQSMNRVSGLRRRL
tara:strand:+ start:1710 stop:2240 length:531 start_codon:yes stop_codon:yes gene_type:complete